MLSRGVRRRNAQRLPHVRAALQYVAVCGGEDVAIEPGRAIRLRWRYEAHAMAISLPGTSGQAEREASLACQAIRRQYRAIGVEVGA